MRASAHRCPVCQKQMVLDCYRGIEIDKCHEHGIWLDQGELEKIIRSVRRTVDGQLKRARRDSFDKGRTQGPLLDYFSFLKR